MTSLYPRERVEEILQPLTVPVCHTVDRHFSGQKGLIIAAVDLAALGPAVRWEPSRHGQLFPHLYGSLHREFVIAWCSLERHANGTVRLPA